MAAIFLCHNPRKGGTIFVTGESLHILPENTDVFSDGPFTSTLWPYFQLFCIRGFWENLLLFLFAFMLELTSPYRKQFDVICR